MFVYTQMKEKPSKILSCLQSHGRHSKRVATSWSFQKPSWGNLVTVSKHQLQTSWKNQGTAEISKACSLPPWLPELPNRNRPPPWVQEEKLARNTKLANTNILLGPSQYLRVISPLSIFLEMTQTLTSKTHNIKTELFLNLKNKRRPARNWKSFTCPSPLHS